MSNEIKNTLKDVRTAYRFIYQYQRKILDLIGFIGSSYGLNYNGGSARFSDTTPRKGKGQLGCWSWDWLNMYFYEFCFRPISKNGDLLTFSVVHVSDTGSFIANKNDSKNSRTRLSAYANVENSESRLIFYIVKNEFKDFWLNWEINDFVLDEKGLVANDQNIMLFKGYNLEDFENEEKALFQLKDFESYCLLHEINFKVIENKLKK